MSITGAGYGAEVIAKALKDQGIQFVFGIVGVPVIEVGAACISEGLTFIGCRNEQAASYAAGAVGYLTGTPGVCLVVSGPGVVHGLAGLANAQQNCWPCIVIGGASDMSLSSKGAFQESPQVEYARPYCKYVAQFDSLERVPFYVEKAVRMATYGRPGACYLDLPGNFVNQPPDEKKLKYLPKALPPPMSLADPREIVKAIEVLKGAKRPLLIVGKGAAYGRAEKELERLLSLTNMPFLATPMGKGCVPDDHPNSIAPARSTALKSADVIILCGGRLNWILHFGASPRFRADVKIIQMDVFPEEFGNNVAPAASLCGHISLVADQLNGALQHANISKIDRSGEWWRLLAEKLDNNRRASRELMADESVPMSYYRAFNEIQQVLSSSYRDAIIVSEGANTMDIGRTILENYFPRHRLDAGSYGTMGVGLGFAIAASLVHPDKQIICVEGDSAFGFSGMEVETACRYKLSNITFIIINNSGIGVGLPIEEEASRQELLDGGVPVTSLSTCCHYEQVISGFGGKAFYVEDPKLIQDTLKAAIVHPMPCIINIIISPFSGRKKQEFTWLTREEGDETSSKL